MSKVTSKLQVTLPKSLADQYCIRPGDEIEWSASGEFIKVVPHSGRPEQASRDDLRSRLNQFDQATLRQKQRQPATLPKPPSSRGWTRQDLYRDESGSC